MTAAIHGKTLAEWRELLPGLDAVTSARPTLWINPGYTDFACACEGQALTATDIDDARQRLERFAPYLARVFPEARERAGLIESPLREVRQLKRRLGDVFDREIPSRLLLKCDNELAVAGSIKARGGFHEVLKHAEALAAEHGLLDCAADYSQFAGDAFRKLFSGYSIAVGSTGNLGLSIGILAAQLGFRATVHMSADARQWKKELLRERGVEVIEYQADYGEAVRAGRARAENDPRMHFVDDERSADLFLGYAVAARRLETQLESLDIAVDADHPLFVYLPCGVGGGPGGIAFGLKHAFGDHVHCFFAEPVASPCMLLGLMTGLHEAVDVRDFGLDNRTEADGLAVARPSGFVGRTLDGMISGVYTIEDGLLYRLLAMTRDCERIDLEPSAAAGIAGPAMLLESEAGCEYLEAHGLQSRLSGSTHLAWATGGSLVPAAEMDAYYRKGLFRCG